MNPGEQRNLICKEKLRDPAEQRPHYDRERLRNRLARGTWKAKTESQKQRKSETKSMYNKTELEIEREQKPLRENKRESKPQRVMTWILMALQCPIPSFLMSAKWHPLLLVTKAFSVQSHLCSSALAVPLPETPTFPVPPPNWLKSSQSFQTVLVLTSW